ncbi:MAG: FeoB-associated Cys-rich membrane protein [Clostridia bacterium]|nr:FeoB-associated Cys-rich membrane protein [Clostridia bacterium]
MVEFFTNNLATIITAIVVFALVAAAVVKIVRDKIRHKSSCGCGCANCPISGSCNKKNTDDQPV